MIKVFKRLLCLLLFLPLSFNLSPAAGEGLGVREVKVFNPLPTLYTDLVPLDLNFIEGEAFNGTLSVLDPAGVRLPAQLVNCTFYPSGYYRSCRILFPVKVPPFNSSRYTIVYYSTPLKRDTGPTGNLTVTLANLTLIAFNATGSYAVNVTRGLVVRGPGYLAVFNNSTLLRLSFTDTGVNLVFTDWPFAGFVTLANGSIVSSGYDLSSCKVELLLNGSLLAKVRQVCSNRNITVKQVFTFTSLGPLVRIDAEIDGIREGIVYFPYLRIPSGSFTQAFINGSSVEATKERSFVPAPRWVGLRGSREWLVLAVNFTTLKAKELIESLNSTVWKAYVNETIAARRAFYERMLKLRANFSRLLSASELVATGRYNTTALLLEARSLEKERAYLDALLDNVTTILEKPERKPYRLLLVPREGVINLAYQLTGKPQPTRLTLLLAMVDGDPQAWIRGELLKGVVDLAVSYAPVSAKLNSPEETMVDDYIVVSADVSSVSKLSNVSLSLEYPRKAFTLVEGKSKVNFTSLEGVRRVQWVLKAMYEGEWTLLLNVTSSWGSLVAKRAINVSLPPIVPKIVIPRNFNVTITCVDARGRPLAGYLVNLYENSTHTLAAAGFTNESGLIRFLNLSAGVYRLEVTDGLHSSWSTLLVYSNRNIALKVGLVSLKVRVLIAEAEPLPQAAVYVRDEEGRIACTGFTDRNGVTVCETLPRGNYTVSVRWQGSIAGSARVTLVNDTEVSLQGLVKRVTIYVDLGGKPAGGTLINVHSATGTLVTTTRTDERGIAVLYLLPGPYRFTASKGQYTVTRMTDVRVEQYIRLELGLSLSLWVLIAVTTVLWFAMAYAWHRKTSFVYRERERYRRLLQRLEELYNRGEVEERFYLKLKQEYEDKLNELSRGEAL